ncbi:GntR family transcriptional regulator [Phreatobacter aquaticus]|uniref:GntR family transcriptional regulator n=1 Tax=Phreatobacter aquaticus TaxID=2570229 RepID=A0A4D7QI43_9HYPH|nr:GntR family transcriptional regulator [Phreatobacter aquaticus]QCK86605.1 GntR family transcriptional regulator [Phreatobacter aquaticus]
MASDTPIPADDLARSSANLSGLAYAALAQMIHGHKLRGGDVILEAKLAAELSISRTPMREALQRLEGEGLIVKNASRSYMVRTVGLTEYLQSLKVREILEPETAALAIGNIDPAAMEAVRAEIAALNGSRSYVRDAHWTSDANLHNLFIDACGNQVMSHMIKGLRATTHLFEIDRLKDRLIPDNTEHVAILDALAEGDAKAVRKAVHHHIRSLHRFALSVVS